MIDVVLASILNTFLTEVYTGSLILLIILIILRVNKNKEKFNKIHTQFALYIIGIIVANIQIIILFSNTFFGLFQLIPIVLFTTAWVLLVKNKDEKYTKKITIIQRIAVILIIIIPFAVVIPNEIYDYHHPKKYYSSTYREALEHNSSFESYFGTEVTLTEVKNLLSEIRTNNSFSVRNEEACVIGVCFISKNTATRKPGIYKDYLNPNDITEDTFNSYMFTTDTQAITQELTSGTLYTVGVPNTNAFTEDQQALSGFESDDGSDPLGKDQTGETGGYYSSGYIRLIYIVDNANKN